MNVLADGTSVEVALVGPDGMVGLEIFLGAPEATQQNFVQVAGNAYRISAQALQAELARSLPLRDLLGRYAHAVFTFLAQTSACNRRHLIEQRCARWLLTVRDSLTRDDFELTQSFLSQMLGVRRATVTGVALSFQRLGLIEYSRGHVRITDRDGLERMSCECYAVIRNQLARVVGRPGIADPLNNLTVSAGGYSTAGDGA